MVFGFCQEGGCLQNTSITDTAYQGFFFISFIFTTVALWVTHSPKNTEDVGATQIQADTLTWMTT